MSKVQNLILRSLVVVFLLLALIWGLVPLPEVSGRLDNFPLKGEKVFGQNLTLSVEEEKLFADCRVIKRLYTAPKDDVIVIVVEASKNRHAIHDPSYCLVGAGWKIEKRQRFLLPHGEAEKLSASHPEKGEAEVLYWYTDGSKSFRSTPEYWWKASLRRFTVGRSGQEPVLVMLSALSADQIHWSRFLLAFPELQEI